MMTRAWHTVALVVILAVGCGAADPGDEPTRAHEPAAPASQAIAPAQAPTHSDTPQVDPQAQRIDELEAKLDALRWTEQDAIAVVQSKLRERLAACQAHRSRDNDGLLPSTDAVCSEDPVLKAFGSGAAAPGLRVNFITAIAKTLLEHGKWTAVSDPNSSRWLVQVVSLPEDGLPAQKFYAHEKTGLVEGIPFQEPFREFNPEQFEKQFGFPPK